MKRDADGRILALSQRPEGGCDEPVAADDPQVSDYLRGLADGGDPLSASDQDFVRVLEDLVELLMSKGVILFTELPDSAQQKILNRQRWRSQRGTALDLLSED
ncbi:MAG: hypothetical protein R3228_04295 [Halioglobus sp.]|nr:hypothetical protein [Halioglobus sp.]